MELDIRTKLVITLLIATCVSLNSNIYVELFLMLFLAVLQLLSGKDVFAPRLVLCYGIFVIIQYLVFPAVPDWVSMILSMFVVNVRSFFPIAMCLVLIYRTTRISQMMATLTKMKVPKGIMISIAIAIRYFPTLAEEVRALHDAMSIRNITNGIKSPIKKVAVKAECYLVPVFISAIKTADELSAAAITRGIENPGQPSCRNYKNMAFQDYVVFVIVVALTVGSIYVRYGGGTRWF